MAVKAVQANTDRVHPELQRAFAELQAGGPAGAERALALLHDTAFRFSMRVCGHREDAEDNAQETLLRTTPVLAKMTSPQALAVWLYKVARTRCLMSRRRSRFAPQAELSLEVLMPEPGELERLLAARDADPERRAIVAESAARLRRALDQLPPDYRMVLVLHDMEELGTAEIAQVTGLKPGAVRVRLHRARLFLRRELAGEQRRRRGRPPQRKRRCRELFAALSEYVDQQLAPGMCRKLEAHLADCKPCEAFLESLFHTVEQCRRYDPAGRRTCGEKVLAQVRRMLTTNGV